MDEISSCVTELLLKYTSNDLEKMYTETKSTNFLDNPDVIKWIKGDTSFLPSGTKIQKKKYEDSWGLSLLKSKKLTVKNNGQWTGPFGEELCKEAFQLLGKSPKKPCKKINEKNKVLKPDIETDDYIIEVKNGTYFTYGTAHEKIPAVPSKYAAVPELYNKPLRIVCVGYAEIWAREDGILPGLVISKHTQADLLNWKTKQIEYMAFTDLIQELHSQGIPGF